MRRTAVLFATGSLLASALTVAPANAAPSGPQPAGDQAPKVFVGEVTAGQVGQLRAAGLDREDIASAPAGRNRVRVEVVLSQRQADKLRGDGISLTEKRIDGQTASQRIAAEAAAGYEVFRSYSEPGGIRDELVRTAAAHPGLAKLVSLGKSRQGKDILAVKVTRNARAVPDGARPSVLYAAAQHAREWITPEMNRRLLHYVLDRYRTDSAIRRVVDTTELWFVPVANPDGYDYTFTPGNRLWRKNLRDNDADGQITGSDGVDPNRNYPTRWGYDNEGSSPSIGSQTYRGPAPASEPETRALDRLLRRIDFEFMINYHSAAELLLYGTGWQVATPTPDDLLYEAMAGDDANPAVPGYDPDIAAELYTTNGETTEHAHNVYGTLAFTPEMATCETASAADPDDEFVPEDCASGFNFPDSEPLVQAEFEKNIPFALAVAQSAPHPADPVSVVGRQVPNFAVDSFAVSYGSPQTVAVTARRDLRDLTLRYSVAGGPVQQARVEEWDGGERYGDGSDTYYGEFRGTVRGVRPGQRVEVWFTGRRAGHARTGGGRTVSSEHFTYRLARDSRARVLVVANEDYEGVNPDYPPTVTGPKHARTYLDGLRANGIAAELWDVSAQGVPHDLGVLAHFDAVVWYLGDNRLTQDPEDAVTRTPLGNLPDASVAERQQYLTLAVRDFLNEGGRLLLTGETAGYYGVLGSTVGGIYYGLDGAPESDCVVTQDFFSDCLLLADDFTQYYLGATSRSASAGPTALNGADRPLTGASFQLGGPATTDNPLDEAGSFTVTSDVLSPEQFPQFRSWASGTYAMGSGPGPFDPFEGEWYAGAVHVDDSYQRLARTVDLTGTTAAAAPRLEFALSFDTEPGYDNVIVEAHTVGQDDWTTLPELGGRTDTEPPTECEAEFLLDEHPWLEHYLTRGNPCQPTGTSGSWNRFTGNSGGWQQVAFDLSAYAGAQVEVSVSYVTDGSTGGAGVFVDDTRISVGGQPTAAEGFETALGAWTVPGPPAGSPPNTSDFQRAQTLVAAAVSTPDTVLLGFGAEQVATAAERAALLGRIARYLLR